MKIKRLSVVLSLTISAMTLASCDFLSNFFKHTHDLQKIEAVNPTCTRDGNYEYYKCTSCGKYFDVDKTTEVTLADVTSLKTGHNFGNVSYVWNDELKKVTASRECNNGCGETESETVQATLTSEVEADCQHAKTQKYSAEFTNTAFNPTTKTYTIGGVGEHEYGQVTYSWDDETKVCTASRTCAKCQGTDVEVGAMSSVQKSAATCTEDEIRIYTATFTKDGFVSQTKEYAGQSKLGHDLESLSIVGELTNKDYVSGQEISLDGLSFSGVCSRGDAVELSYEDIDIAYVNEGSAFKAGETSVTLSYGSLSKVVYVNEVQKQTNSISGLDDQYDFVCGETFAEEDVASDFGDITFSYKDKDENVVENVGFIEEKSPYTVTATVAEDSEYKAITMTATINVEHSFEESATCECGKSTVENLFFALNGEKFDVYTDEATGLAATLVKNLQAEWYNADGTEEFTIDNDDINKEVEAIVVVGEEAMRVKGFVCSKFITDKDSLNSALDEIRAPGNNTGYYMLLNDILNAGVLHEASNENRFAGVFDGHGHKITNYEAWGRGFFGTVSNATIKDISFIGAKSNRLIYFADGNINFENFEFNLASGKASVSGKGALTLSYNGNLNFKNSKISGIDKEGDAVLAKNDSSPNLPTFENTTFVCHSKAKMVDNLDDIARQGHGNAYTDGLRYANEIEGLTLVNTDASLVDETFYIDLTRKTYDASDITKDLTGWTVTSEIGFNSIDYSKLSVTENGFVYVTKEGETPLQYKAIVATKLIRNAEDFESIRCPKGNTSDANSRTNTDYYLLVDDINSPDMAYPISEIADYLGVVTPTGAQMSAFATAHKFAATINGNGHTVSDLIIDNTRPMGMFGGNTNGATIKNITFDGIKTGWTTAGGGLMNQYVSMFGYNLANTLLENVTMKLGDADGNGHFGNASNYLFCQQLLTGLKFKNFTLDMNGLEVVGGGETVFCEETSLASGKLLPTFENFQIINNTKNVKVYFTRKESGQVKFGDMTLISGFDGWVKPAA